MKTLRDYINLIESAEQGVAEGWNSTYVVKVMDKVTGEHWAIDVKVTSPEAAKERAEAMGYKVLQVKEKGVAEGEAAARMGMMSAVGSDATDPAEQRQKMAQQTVERMQNK